jgi:hypothetical protein
VIWSRACLVVIVAGCGRLGFPDAPDAAPDAPYTYAERVLADGPIAYWRLGEATALPARDELGRDPGQYSGICTFAVPGAIAGDTAVTFDGNTCRLVLAGDYAFAGTAAFTAEAWVRIAPGGPGYRNIISQQSRDTQDPIDGWSMIISPTGAQVQRVIGLTQSSTPPVAVPTSKYIHIVGTYDGQMEKLYIDGVVVSTAADVRVQPAFTAPPLIGTSVTGNRFSGELDEVALYDFALDAVQIAAHFAAR